MMGRIFGTWDETHSELWSHQPIRLEHEMHKSPAFSMDDLAQLIESYPREHYSLVKTGAKGSSRVWREGDIGNLSGRQVIEAISRGGLWLNMRDVGSVDSRYRKLIDRMFEEIAAGLKQDQRAYSGECQPALDVLETDRAVEIVMDVAGVPKNGVRVLFSADVVIIAGEKGPPAASQSHAFHLVEREFGRFVRTVRLNGAFDIANSHATLHDGELTIVLPKQAERRGRAHDVRIT